MSGTCTPRRRSFDSPLLTNGQWIGRSAGRTLPSFRLYENGKTGMYLSTERFLKAFAAIDAANSADPSRITVDGANVPAELAYSRWMTQALEEFQPDAPEEVYLAARAQHIQIGRAH